MQDPASLWLFFVLVFGVIVLPGMDMAYVAGSSLTAGLRGGLVAVAGIVAAGLLHTAVAASGLAALVVLWPAAYNALLLAGGAYMVWVGASLLREAFASGPATAAPAAAGLATPLAIFRNGALSCLLNPKAYAFMLAVFPAFMARPPQPALLRTVQMGAIIAGTQIAVYGTVAVLAAAAHRWRGQGLRSQRWSMATVGTALMAGAVFTLLLAWQPARAAADSAQDFDFLNGHWHIQNRKLVGLLQGSQRWESFEATSRARPLPGSVGQLDEFTAPAWRPGYTGVTLRIHHAGSGRWSLYSLDSRGNGLDSSSGALAPPVVGRWVGDVGIFEGRDTLNGRAILVRYRWTRIDADHARWEQSFSADQGQTWEANWLMELTRLAQTSIRAQ